MTKDWLITSNGNQTSAKFHTVTIQVATHNSVIFKGKQSLRRMSQLNSFPSNKTVLSELKELFLMHRSCLDTPSPSTAHRFLSLVSPKRAQEGKL